MVYDINYISLLTTRIISINQYTRDGPFIDPGMRHYVETN